MRERLEGINREMDHARSDQALTPLRRLEVLTALTAELIAIHRELSLLPDESS
jgi:hypothetical protein